jgi:phosphate transport system substrate-binding protein
MSLIGKYILLLVLPLFLLNSCKPDENSITLSGAFGLYPLAIKWAEEYNKVHPEIRFDISAGGAGKGMADVLTGNVDIGMLSRDLNERESEQGAFPISVAKDAVIPTFNTHNPNTSTILSQGLSLDDFRNIWLSDNVYLWGDFLGSTNKSPVKVYTRSDAAGAPETWAKYLGKKQEDLRGIGVFGDPGLAQAVKNDPNAIGFNNVLYVYDMKTGKPHPGLGVIPIDLNDNGTIDADEDFYSDITQIIDAIGHDIFPSPPARELYFVMKGKPERKAVIDFLKWTLKEGQAFVNQAGYINLPKLITEEQLKKLDAQKAMANQF